MKNIPFICTLIGASMNTLYMSNAYPMFKPTIGNRNGLQQKRVKYFIDKIKKGEFYPVLGLIYVDKDGNILEGHHRFEALKKEKQMIIFVVTDEMSLNQIADFNSSPNQKWNSEDHFASAIKGRSAVAIILNELRDTLTNRYGIADNKLSASEMYGVLVKNVKHFGSGMNSPKRDMYFNDKLLNAVKGRTFRKDVDLFALLKREFKNNREGYKYCKEIMKAHFGEVMNFNLATFCDNLTNTSFNVKEANVQSIKAEMLRIHNIGLDKSARAVA